MVMVIYCYMYNIYIYIYRERERERVRMIYIYIYPVADANPATVLLEASKQQASKQARKQTARKQAARKQEASKETGRKQANSEQEASVKCERGTNRCAYLSSRFLSENSNYGVPGIILGFILAPFGKKRCEAGKTRCGAGKTRSARRNKQVFWTSAPCRWGPNFGHFPAKIKTKTFPGAFILQVMANTYLKVKINEKHMISDP